MRRGYLGVLSRDRTFFTETMSSVKLSSNYGSPADIWVCYIPNFALGNGISECRRGFSEPFFVGAFLFLVKWWYQNSDVAALAWKEDVRGFERCREGFSYSFTVAHLGVQNRVLQFFMFGS